MVRGCARRYRFSGAHRQPRRAHGKLMRWRAGSDTSSSGVELLLGSGVGSARAELRRNTCSRRRRAWEPSNHARASGCTLTTPSFPRRFGGAALKPALPTTPPGLGCPFTAFGKAVFPAQALPTRQLSPGARRGKLVASCRSPRQRRRIPSYSVVLSFTPLYSLFQEVRGCYAHTVPANSRNP